MIDILYCRVSSIDQKTDRQKVQESNYGKVVEDTVSGSIPFFDRQGGKEILKLIEKGVVKSLTVLTIDRLGRNLLDILNTISFFNKKKICIHFFSQGLRTLDETGKENSITKMMIGILGTVAEMERNQIKERQMEGIAVAKLKGVYTGRMKGSTEKDFLSKPKNKKALEYLKKGNTVAEVAKLTELHLHTVRKVKKLGLTTP